MFVHVVLYIYIYIYDYVCVCACDFTSFKSPAYIHDKCTYRHQFKSKPHKLRRVRITYINFPRIGGSKKQPTPSTGEPFEARTMCKSCRPRKMPKAFGRSCMGGPWHPKNTKSTCLCRWKNNKPNKKLDGLRMAGFFERDFEMCFFCFF